MYGHAQLGELLYHCIGTTRWINFERNIHVTSWDLRIDDEALFRDSDLLLVKT